MPHLTRSGREAIVPAGGFDEPLAAAPTATFIGHHVLIGMSMGMGCLLRNDDRAPYRVPPRA